MGRFGVVDPAIFNLGAAIKGGDFIFNLGGYVWVIFELCYSRRFGRRFLVVIVSVMIIGSVATAFLLCESGANCIVVFSNGMPLGAFNHFRKVVIVDP